MRTAFTELVGVNHPVAGFNRSPAVVVEVTKAGGFGVLAASAYTPAELDAQLTWIDQQVAGRPGPLVLEFEILLRAPVRHLKLPTYRVSFLYLTRCGMIESWPSRRILSFS